MVSSLFLAPLSPVYRAGQEALLMVGVVILFAGDECKGNRRSFDFAQDDNVLVGPLTSLRMTIFWGARERTSNCNRNRRSFDFAQDDNFLVGWFGEASAKANAGPSTLLRMTTLGGAGENEQLQPQVLRLCSG